MNPKACYTRLIDALESKDNIETVQAVSDLLGYLLPVPNFGISAADKLRLDILMAQFADRVEKFTDVISAANVALENCYFTLSKMEDKHNERS